MSAGASWAVMQNALYTDPPGSFTIHLPPQTFIPSASWEQIKHVGQNNISKSTSVSVCSAHILVR